MLKATLVNQRLLMKTKKPCYNIATGRMTVVPPEFSVHHSGETLHYLTQNGLNQYLCDRMPT